MYGRSIVTCEGLKDLLIGQIAVEEELLPAPIVAEICLSNMTRGRGRPSIVVELLGRAGNFSAQRLHWLESEADRQILGGGHGAVAPSQGAHDGRPLQTMRADRYVDFTLLARGGCSRVYMAFDRELTRWVAMKVLDGGEAGRDLSDPLHLEAPSSGANAERYQRARERFVLEARRQAKMVHPCVLSVFEVGETPNGVPYFVMPRGTGLTLRDALAEQRLERGKALNLLCRVAEAVGCVHERHDLVHCDLNPGNVMLGEHDEAYILDFGEARRPGSWASLQGVPAAGTPGYAAPELLGAACRIDTTLDTYALGAMLYFVLTGSAPFADRTLLPIAAPSTDRRVLAPAEMIPAANQRLSDLCQRSLATAPEDRPPHAREFAAQLRVALAGRRRA